MADQSEHTVDSLVRMVGLMAHMEDQSEHMNPEDNPDHMVRVHALDLPS
ncbi:MAG: hypothetical protein FWF80_07815 [Defluviitaleaceae bacterium]|nr:hypothetical protein [Defluviitaleaceae bacterium]